MEYRITPGRLEIGKFSLYYERTGEGPAIVFLHGLGGNHFSWWQQVPYFMMRGFECITLDQRSFGLSADPDGTFNSSHASDLGALLDHLKIDKAMLVGQSMGGWTIVGYALEHPERVAAMAMCDTPGGIFTPDMKFDSSARLPVDATPPIGSLPTYAADYFARRPEMAFLYDEMRIHGARPPADAGMRLFQTRYNVDTVKARLKMPILCIVGEADTLITPDIVKALVRVLPDGRLRTVPGSGHSVYFENAAAFNQLVRDFMIDVGYPR